MEVSVENLDEELGDQLVLEGNGPSGRLIWQLLRLKRTSRTQRSTQRVRRGTGERP
jgi:hypothetical protein